MILKIHQINIEGLALFGAALALNVIDIVEVNSGDGYLFIKTDEEKTFYIESINGIPNINSVLQEELERLVSERLWT